MRYKIRNTYAEEQFKQSAQIAGNNFTRADKAWRRFCLIPIDFLEAPGGQTDTEIYDSLNAFLLYRWDAGHMAGLSIGNAMSSQYNAGFTLLRSSLELILNGALYQCLSQRRFRESPSLNLDPTDSLKMLNTHLSTIIRESEVDDSELESNSINIFNLPRRDWMHYAFSLRTGSIIQQLHDWGIFDSLSDNPARFCAESLF